MTERLNHHEMVHMTHPRIQVAVLGGSGYTGGELLRILSGHPYVQVAVVTADKSVGMPISSVFPHLDSFYDLTFEAVDINKLTEQADLIFLALPHTTSMEIVAKCHQAKKPVIDLSADYRLHDPAIYQQWYHTAHTQVPLLKKAVYGLPELHRSKISLSDLIAVPGCYPTAAILQLAPLVAKGFIHLDSIIIDAKSGISGAGRSPGLPYHFPEAHESLTAYKIGTHRHIPEIEQELNGLVSHTTGQPSNAPFHLTFTPHLIPMNRGILSTAYAKLTEPLQTHTLQTLFRSFYEGEPFIRIRDESTSISPHYVRGSNFCDLAVMAEPRTQSVITVAAIDNLVKGAAGQAIQVMNILKGFPEETGLAYPAAFP